MGASDQGDDDEDDDEDDDDDDADDGGDKDKEDSDEDLRNRYLQNTNLCTAISTWHWGALCRGRFLQK